MIARPGVEAALARALWWTLAGAAMSLPLLLVPQPDATDLMAYTIAHLSALVAFGLALTLDLRRLLEDQWFQWLGPLGRWIATGAAAVALVVGVVALVTIPTSAALRLTPSLQYLQLLSALDIAWAAGATLIGVSWWARRQIGSLAGVVVGVVCVWSIWKYLDIVGFAGDGGWLVDGSALMRYVLPYDMMAASIAVVTLVGGARHLARQRHGASTTAQ